MTASRRRFSQEFKDELCLEVISTSKTIKNVADAYGVGTETLRKWLVKYRDANGGTEADLTLTERARLKELERNAARLLGHLCFVGLFGLANSSSAMRVAVQEASNDCCATLRGRLFTSVLCCPHPF